MSLFENFSFFNAQKTESKEEEPQTSVLWAENRAEKIVSQLEIPTQRIVEKLSRVLESGEIQLIIGDDASGRIPTAIFRKIFDIAYKERGFTVPETRFFAGSKELRGKNKEEKKQKIGEFLVKVKNEVEQKFGRPLENVFVVTDTINTGVSLDPLIEKLNEMGMKVKIASIGVEANYEEVEKLESRWKTPILFGEETTPSVYADSAISGVSKSPKELFSTPLKQDYYRNPENQKIIQKTINKSREVADNLALKIYEEWTSSQKNK